MPVSHHWSNCLDLLHHWYITLVFWGVNHFLGAEACICTRPEEDILPDYILTCQEAGVEACDCSDTECTVRFIFTK